MAYAEVSALPDVVLVQTGEKWIGLERHNTEQWVHEDIELRINDNAGVIDIELSALSTPVKRIIAKWKQSVGTRVRILGDHWERGYGDLEWRGIAPDRIMPWYFLVYDNGITCGYGVKVRPNALCFWQVSETAITLCMDVRNGTEGVNLNGKNLKVCEIVTRKGSEGETPFEAARALCKMMCSDPVMPSFPVYGGNNWYYAYGKSSHKEILDDAKRVSDWASNSENRPFMVIDDGWQEKYCYTGDYNGGPWKCGNSLFPDMAALAHMMKETGTRPGLWFRPLLTVENLPDEWFLSQSRFSSPFPYRILDPSRPEVLRTIAGDIRRFVSWGYELIKYDFSTFDIFGKWGYQMIWKVTDGRWAFSDRSKTTAQIIKDLYEAIYKACGDALLIGCNTVGHLGAGLFHMHRTGDDTSGREWERTRKMGINSLAFRAPQHGAFFSTDADCVGLTLNIPWERNKQWLTLLALSGTPLFVSAAPDAVGKEQEKEIRKAFDMASRELPLAQALDWMDTTSPRHWLLNGEEYTFNWDDLGGVTFCY